MVCTENDLSNWENFPKGLRVLLLDADVDADTTSKLKSMDYIVTTFMDENEALSAFSKKPENFHIAIVEVNTFDKNKSFKFLESVKNLPTIMTSRDHCLTTMMKCIALGAVEFLHKPLSEDKLKNIWQHVVHKAFNDDGSTLSGSSLKPVKESVVSMLHFEMGNQGNPRRHENNSDMTNDEKDPAPSTPQLKQGSRLMNDGDCQENANSSSEKEDNVESKSVETTNRNEDSNHLAVKEEGEGETDEVKSENDNNAQNVTASNKPSGNKNVTANKGNRKKVDWTPELHKKFVQAVEQLGVDQAIPSRILELMKVEGLTRHNVASHLQKFRMHRRNILPKDDHDRRWIQPRDNNHHHNHHHYHLHRQMHRSFNGYSQRPVMAYPAPPMYPVWGMPGVAHPPPVWPPASCNYPPWQPSDGWYWKPPYPPTHGNAWGCPVGPPAIRPCNSAGNETGFRMPTNSVNFEPDEEIIDMVVKEAMSKPWLPLPLGLKPPSPDSVLAELSRQGISAVPSPSSLGLINGSRLC